jgi:RNase P subunit RPR2
MPKNIKPSPCPTCKTILDSLKGITSSNPKAGECTLTVCTMCGELMRFNNEMEHEKIPGDMLTDLRRKHPDTYDALIRAQKAVRQARKELGQKPADN